MTKSLGVKIRFKRHLKIAKFGSENATFLEVSTVYVLIYTDLKAPISKSNNGVVPLIGIFVELIVLSL